MSQESPLQRLLAPRSVAVIGGGAWCANVIDELGKIGFSGAVWRVHPREGFASVADLPGVPDAAFIGVNREATIAVVGALAAMGAGGAVCFASGFAEAAAELDGSEDLQADLLAAAGDMPILGPNCYGMINYLDRVALWPDQHGAVAVERGVALITQSSNMAINLTMQARGLPLAYVVTAGNQAQQGLADIARAVLADPRVTGLGLHIEGIGDVAAFDALARHAASLGKPIVALKVGRSEQAQVATISHTASLAGSHAGAQALFERCGVAQVDSLEGLLEALKIAHLHGMLPHSDVASLSCSGGEASLMADLGGRFGVGFPPLRAPQRAALRAALGPRVALANPLDYHTYIWGDETAMAQAFAAMMTEDHALGLLVLDVPRGDRCEADAWEPAFRAVARAQDMSGRPMAVLASLAETMPEEIATRLMGQGIVPLCGMGAALEAIGAMCRRQVATEPAAPPRVACAGEMVAEAAAKARLADHGLRVPVSREVTRGEIAEAAGVVGFPLVLKAVGLAHKSDAGGVALGLGSADAVVRAAEAMPGTDFLLEELVAGAVVELLVGVVNDPAHGLLLTLGRGGVETELQHDVTHALLPVSRADVGGLLDRLRAAPLLGGFRGRAAADVEAVIDAVMAVQAFVLSAPGVREVEINPLLALPQGAVAVDALIREEMP